MLASPEGVHNDFTTKEYQVMDKISAKKWEATRDITMAFGYNRASKTFMSGAALIHLFCDVVAKNGNLLINVGPQADGSIPDNQLQPLLALGLWLDGHHQGLMGSRPYKVFGETIEPLNIEVRYTQKDETIYAYLLANPGVEAFHLRQIDPSTFRRATLLGYGELSIEPSAAGVSILWPQE